MGYESEPHDHGGHQVIGARLEEVSPSSCHIADVIPHQIGDYSRVARVILRYPGLDLAHQVSAHIGGLGVYPSPHLGEEGGETGPKAEAHQEAHVFGVLRADAEEDREHGYPQ